MVTTRLDRVWAEALFACDLQPSQHPAHDEIRQEVTGILRRFGPRWCAERVAQEFGDHPETAVHRMAWALEATRDCYPVVATPRLAWIHLVKDREAFA
jgi:hypothetical protein